MIKNEIQNNSGAFDIKKVAKVILWTIGLDICVFRRLGCVIVWHKAHHKGSCSSSLFFRTIHVCLWQIWFIYILAFILQNDLSPTGSWFSKVLLWNDLFGCLRNNCRYLAFIHAFSIWKSWFLKARKHSEFDMITIFCGQGRMKWTKMKLSSHVKW